MRSSGTFTLTHDGAYQPVLPRLGERRYASMTSPRSANDGEFALRSAADLQLPAPEQIRAERAGTVIDMKFVSGDPRWVVAFFPACSHGEESA